MAHYINKSTQINITGYLLKKQDTELIVNKLFLNQEVDLSSPVFIWKSQYTGNEWYLETFPSLDSEKNTFLYVNKTFNLLDINPMSISKRDLEQFDEDVRDLYNDFLVTKDIPNLGSEISTYVFTDTRVKEAIVKEYEKIDDIVGFMIRVDATEMNLAGNIKDDAVIEFLENYLSKEYEMEVEISNIRSNLIKIELSNKPPTE